MSQANSSNCVSCGDTKFCRECKIFAALKDFPDHKALRRTANGQGRCDFYSGPNCIVKKISLRK